MCKVYKYKYVFSAEALAILKGIKIINITVQTKFLNLRDSLSAINSIKNKTNPRYIAILIQNKLDEAKNKKNKLYLFLHITILFY